MPRKPRVEYAGALYHVMSRGDRGEAIYGGDEDRAQFLKTLGEAVERTGWQVHAYVLMRNHYHLLIETPEANLVAGMQWLQSTYTLRYNARHHEHGHVFQGRYKAILIEPDERGFTQRVSTYIHLNPLRAGLIRWPEESLGQYRWSSVAIYMGKMARPEWLTLGLVLDSVGIDAERHGWARDYTVHIERCCREWATKKGRKGLDDEWTALRRGWCLGGSEFREKLAEAIDRRLSGKKSESHGGLEKRAHDERAAEALLAEGLRRVGLKSDDLPRMKKGDPRKKVLAWWLRRNTSVRTDWISQHLVLGHRTSVSKAVGEVQRGQEPELRKYWQRLKVRGLVL